MRLATCTRSSRILESKIENGGLREALDSAGLMISHFFETIEGWFTFGEIYQQAIREAYNGSKFVEVGSWFGRSAAWMAVEIMNSGKDIDFYCVDTWKGSVDLPWMADYLKPFGGSCKQAFQENMNRGGVADLVRAIEMDSAEAARLFKDESLDFVFIDAGHDYESVREDVRAWYPKVKPGGVLAGDDANWPEVIPGVRDTIPEDQFELRCQGVHWWHRKGERKSEKGNVRAASGRQLVQLAREYLGEKYVLSARVPKNNSEWNGPWNCSEFVSWLVFQVSGGLYGCDNDSGDPRMAHAFTGYWNRDAQSRGQIITIEQAARTPGAAVLRLPQPGTTGHIVISDGQNGTIEAHSPNTGVIAFTLNGRRWDLAILVPGIAYVEGPMVAVSPPSTTIYRLRQPFMTGDKVAQIQERLKAAGCDPGWLDGAFGPYTHAAVVAFQNLHGLVPDGEVGAQTAAALGIHL